MEASPLFSVIIPTFNRSHLISKAIESTLHQSYENWELLIIDDGSTDNTKNVVNSYSDKRIKYIYQEHAERSTARNNGIKNAKGLYICFMDDDDYYLENHLELFQNEIEKQKYPVKIFRNGFYFMDKGKLKKSKNYPLNSKVHPVRFWAFHFCSACTLAIHKECLFQNKFPTNYEYWEDTHLILRLLAEFPFQQIPSYTYIYSMYDEMGSRSVFNDGNLRKVCNKNIAAINDLFDASQDLLIKCLPKNTRQKLVSKKYQDYAEAALFYKKRKDSKYFFFKSLSNGIHFSLSLRYAYWLIRFIFSGVVYPKSKSID
ncbi:MAG TPA: glycosyltransferase family 2 protein [Saprospiraceae bacterium]|nr:glycosyltransferase family 2 protein [Saprospiraceae bacterium]